MLGNEAFGLESISSVLQVLMGCDHVNTLRVKCNIFYPVDFSALTFIRGLSPLTDVDADLRYHWALLTEQGRRNVEAELFSALASKNKLIRVEVKETTEQGQLETARRCCTPESEPHRSPANASLLHQRAYEVP